MKLVKNASLSEKEEQWSKFLTTINPTRSSYQRDSVWYFMTTDLLS